LRDVRPATTAFTEADRPALPTRGLRFAATVSATTIGQPAAGAIRRDFGRVPFLCSSYASRPPAPLALLSADERRLEAVPAQLSPEESRSSKVSRIPRSHPRNTRVHAGSRWRPVGRARAEVQRWPRVALEGLIVVHAPRAGRRRSQPAGARSPCDSEQALTVAFGGDEASPSDLYRIPHGAAVSMAPALASPIEEDQLSAFRRGQDCPSPGITGAGHLFGLARSEQRSKRWEEVGKHRRRLLETDLRRIQLTIWPFATRCRYRVISAAPRGAVARSLSTVSDRAPRPAGVIPVPTIPISRCRSPTSLLRVQRGSRPRGPAAGRLCRSPHRCRTLDWRRGSPVSPIPRPREATGSEDGLELGDLSR
jgi:hypothetical protein